MKVIFTSRFAKDIRTIRDRSVKQDVLQAIDTMKAASRLEDFGDVVKMKGHKTAFRLRLGNYRIGFFFDGESIVLARFADRKDIYKLFP